jgi:hypothetical protein
MIPVAAIVKVHAGNVRFGLWLPLILVWALVLPFAILFSPFFLIGAWATRVNPARAIGALVGMTCALPGLLVEIESPGAAVLVRIY